MAEAAIREKEQESEAWNEAKAEATAKLEKIKKDYTKLCNAIEKDTHEMEKLQTALNRARGERNDVLPLRVNDLKEDMQLRTNMVNE